MAGRPGPAELGLLRLARELAGLATARTATAPALAAVLERLAAHFTAEAPLPGMLFEAWRRSRGHKSRALALAWAREQLRLALQEVLERVARDTAIRRDVPVATLAWLLLAGCEALAHEPPAAVPDRVRDLVALVTRVSAR